MPRLFVSLEVPDEGLRPIVSFPAAQPAHVTLAFLGDVPEERISALERTLAEAATSTAPFEFVLQGVGAFPGRQRPRVVWVGFAQGNAQISRLAAKVAEAIRLWGGPIEPRPFTAHVTLFRVNNPGLHRRAQEVLRLPPDSAFGGGEAKEIRLRESHLLRGGATHSVRRAFTLGTGPPSAGPNEEHRSPASPPRDSADTLNLG